MESISLGYCCVTDGSSEVERINVILCVGGSDVLSIRKWSVNRDSLPSKSKCSKTSCVFPVVRTLPSIFRADGAKTRNYPYRFLRL